MILFTDRNRAELRRFREEEEARERAEREERERPIREAEAKLNATAQKLRELEIQVLTTGEDPDLFIDPTVAPGVTMTPAQAKELNARSFAEYRDNHPEFYRCDENAALVSEYFNRSGIRLVTLPMVEALVNRLRDAGLLKEAPVPEPGLVAEPESEPETVAQAEGLDGIDPDTGEPRHYSDFEVSRMSADEYRRAAGVRLIHPSGPRRWW